MSVDLSPRIIESHDTEYFEADGNKVRRVTIVTYRLGEFGPYREEFERDAFTETELRSRMARKAETLKPFT